MDKTFKKKVKFIYHVADFFGPSNLMLDHSFGHIVEKSRERASYEEASSPARALPHELFANVCYERIYYSSVKGTCCRVYSSIVTLKKITRNDGK
jgi:hypothetical protein